MYAAAAAAWFLQGVTHYRGRPPIVGETPYRGCLTPSRGSPTMATVTHTHIHAHKHAHRLSRKQNTHLERWEKQAEAGWIWALT